MRKFYKWLFDYSSLLKFQTNSLSVKEVVSKLKNISQRNNLAIMWLSAVSSSRIIGNVSEEKVVLYRARPWIKLYFNPYFFGKFSHDGGHIYLEGKFTMSKYAKTIIIFAFIFLCLFIALLILMSLIGPDSPDYSRAQLFIMILVALIMAALIIGMILLVKRWTKKDVELMSTVISKELQV